MSLPPSEIPLGAMRFNSDSQKLEYWMGSAWMQIKTFSPNLDGGNSWMVMLVVDAGGHNPVIKQIDFITISTQGNAIDFGDAATKKSQVQAWLCDQNSRIICMVEALPVDLLHK